MDDMEQSRVTYVHSMEVKMQHMQKELEAYKFAAEKWEPKFTTATNTQTGVVTVGLQFGGKYVHAEVSTDYLQRVDTGTAVADIVDALIKNLVVDQMRARLLPDIERVRSNALATKDAGKW